jgi:hypothetical protein
MLVVVFTASSVLKSGYERESRELLLKQAALTSSCVLRSVEAEVNLYLRSVACSAMYEVGVAGGEENEVVERLENGARRLENGWSFPNVQLALSFENLRELMCWLPDGSLAIRGFLPASAKHVMGPEVYGLRLEVTGLPRFRRLRQLSQLVENPVDENLVLQLNESFGCEGFRFELREGEIAIRDLWAEKVLVKS